MNAYGCVKCQTWHYERDDPLYEAHRFHQSKHGIRQLAAALVRVHWQLHSTASSLADRVADAYEAKP